MSEIQHYVSEIIDRHAWVDEDRHKCGCKGSGWWLSSLDSWHSCPVHNWGQPHPEAYEDADWDEDDSIALVPSEYELERVEYDDDIPF